MENTGKSLFITDFDDTLVHSDSGVIVTHDDGTKERLTPTEYASYEKKPTDTFDFSEFREMRNAKPILRYVELLKKVVRENRADKVVILSARPDGKPIGKFLRAIGITTGVSVVALGSSNPYDKAKYIQNCIHDGYTRIVFIDDASKNIQAVDSLKEKYPEVKLITYQVPPLSDTPSKKKSTDKKKPVARTSTTTAAPAQKKSPSADAGNSNNATQLLKHKIRNPQTGRNILVKSALGYNNDSNVKQAALAYIRKT